MHIARTVKLIKNISTVYLQPISTACKKNGLFCGLLLLNTLFLHAQPADMESVKHYLKAGPVLIIQNIIDKNFSSLPYSGTMAGLGLCFGGSTKKAFHELTCFFSTGTTSPGSSSQSGAETIYTGIDYSHLYTMAKNKNARLQWLAGGAVSYLYTHRNYSGFINNATSFESALSLGAVVKAIYTFKHLRGLSISEKLVIPLVTLLLQPSYGSQHIEGNLDGNGTTVKSLLGASRLVSFGSYLQLTNCLEICKTFDAHHAVSAGYGIEYYQIHTVRPVKNAAQQIILSFQLMF